MSILRILVRLSVCLGILLLALVITPTAKADAYKYTVVPDQILITIPEGNSNVVHYTFTNLGTEPIYIFNFGVRASNPVLPDRTDRARAHYFGPDRSKGIEVTSGDTFDFGYQLRTPKADTQPENFGDPDFGLRTFVPDVEIEVHVGPKITSPLLPPNSGTITPFDVKVVDAVPEPGTMVLVGSGFLFLIALRLANR